MQPAAIALALLLVLWFAPSGFAQDPPSLIFTNNFFVTGDYVVAGAYNMNSNSTTINGITYTTGTINVPDAKTVGKAGNPGIQGVTSVPTGAQVVIALLYWQTAEVSGLAPGAAGTGQNGFFRPVIANGPPSPGYPLSGAILNGHNAASWSQGGCSSGQTGKIVQTYRADVTAYLPEDSNGNILSNSTYQVMLPSVGSQTPLTQGATLVIIYRVLDPTVPLNSIVIYEGPFGQTTMSPNMTQTVQGFYDAAKNPVSKLTHIVGHGLSNKFQTVSLNGVNLPSLYGKEPAFPGYYAGSSGIGWDNPTWIFPQPITGLNPVTPGSASIPTEVVPTNSNPGCVSWGAEIFSTTVQNDDGDGLLNVWKTNQGYCDASIKEGQCTKGDESTGWVDLPGAVLGTPGNPHPDVFVQLDYMCSSLNPGANACSSNIPYCSNLIVNPDGSVSCNTPSYSFDPTLTVDPSDGNKSAIDKVVNAYAGVTGNTSHTPVTLHVIKTNAIDETDPNVTCNDTNAVSPVCSFPNTPGVFNQPGVVGWPAGLLFLQNEFVDSNGNASQLCNPAPPSLPPPPPTCVARFQHGKKDSYRYALFGHALGIANWTLLDGTLTNVTQSANMVTFTTSTPHGLTADSTCTSDGNPLGRVTVAFAITNANLNGVYCIQSATSTTFTIQATYSVKAITHYTPSTDPDLKVASGQAGTISGFSFIGGSDSLITLGSWGASGTSWQVKAGTFMHELGHANGLTHGGLYFDNVTHNPNDYTPTVEANCKPNVQTVMSYLFQVDLLDTGKGTSVVDYSGEALNLLNETTSGAFAGSSLYPNTNWYVPFVSGQAATAHCDGSPSSLSDPNPKMSLISDQPTSSFSWGGSQDLNYDGTLEAALRGHSEWTSTQAMPGLDLRQIGATGSLAVAGGGVGKLGGGGGVGKLGGGGGVGKLGGGGGVGKLGGGGGVGKLGGGGGVGELNVATVNSVTRPPRNLTASEAVSPRTITLSWISPTFGAIVKYNIYESIAGGTFNFLQSVPGVVGAAPGTPYSSPAIMVNCNPGGYRFQVTAVILNPGPQESVPSNTVSTGQNGGALTGCYAPAGFLLSSPANAAHGSIVSVKFTVLDDFNGTNSPVNTADNPALVTLVANGPLPNNCAMVGDTVILANGTLTPQSGVSTFPTPTTLGQYTLNLDTDVLCAGQYTVKLILDNQLALSSHQMATTPLQLGIDVTDFDNTPHVTTLALNAGTVGLAYSTTLTEDGGTLPVTWSVVSGTLPHGVSLSSSGLLSGTPCDKPINYNFTVQVADSAAPKNFATQAFTVTVLPAPVPQINQPTAPESKSPGSPQFALTVNGTGFTTCSIVQWNGTSISPTPNGATQLTATIPSTDVTTAGTASISVANIGSPTSNVDFFQITNSTGSTVFLNQSGTATAVGASPIGVISADFNGDGYLDVAVANSANGTVSIMLGKGDGTFQSAASYPVGNGPSSLIAGDFNNDGNLDLAVTNSTDGTVSILLGDGHGTFSTKSTPSAGTGPSSVVAGDFNGDGTLDLAVADSGANTVSILLGKGDGTFQTAVTYPAGSGPSSVATGDFNRDGKLDLAVTNPSTGQVSILLGNGDGSFQTPVPYSTEAGGNAIAVTAADFNNDGKLDLAVTNVNAGANTVAIFLGNGDGTFQAAVPYPTTTGNLNGPSAITTGDFNGDGKVDLAITDQGDNSVSILLGNGDGSFQSPYEVMTGTPLSNSTAGVAAGDFNRDGRLDVAVANFTDGTVSIMLQAPHVTLTPSPSVPSFGNVAVSSASAPTAVTLTNDGSAALLISASGIAFKGTNPGDFSQTNNCPTSPNTLAAGSNCTINVKFTPTATGARSASLTITDNATGSPQSVSLSGTGIMAPPTGLTGNLASASSVSLTWNASTSATVNTYNVYRGNSPGGESLLTSVAAAANPMFTDSTVQSGKTYYYVVTAVDSNGIESANSNEFSIAVP